MDIKIIDESTGKPKEDKQKEIRSENNVSFPVSSDLMRNAIHQVMGLERYQDQTRYQDDVDTLLEYAKLKTGSNSLNNIKWAIRSLQNKLGSTPIMENKVPYLARFAYLELESQKIAREKKMYKMKHK